ncbi:MAG: hypothetical protein U5J63_09445 [Fodinibius sp.]|nr:hypothetical protein [Fodinibius sp.]
MRKRNTKSLLIKINSRSLSPSDLNDLQQWENEGGHPEPTSNFLRSLSPIRRGEIFEVVSGDFHIEEDAIFYTAEVKVLALP